MTEDARKKLEFRKVLGRINDGLGNENVRDLKNLCYDNIPERKREEIDSGIQLFNVLIEKGLISSEKPQFLCELLNEIGRMDLSEFVRDYIHKRRSRFVYCSYDNCLVFLSANTLAPACVVDKLEFKHLKLISEEVGRDWKMLGRHLGLDESTLDSIQQAYYSDLKEASYQTLLRWQKKAGPEASPQDLKQALTDMKLMAIVHKYLDAV